MKRAFATLLLVLLAAGCVHPVGRAIRREWIGTPKATLTAYMRSWDQTEDTPGQVRHDAIRDEATLSSLKDGEACFDAAVRTGIEFDEPFDQLSPACSGTTASVENEIVTVIDHEYVGNVEKIAVQGVAANAFLGLRVTQPGEKVFRVIERRARLCCLLEKADEPRLKLTSRRMTYNNAPYTLVFEWQVQP